MHVPKAVALAAFCRALKSSWPKERLAPAPAQTTWDNRWDLALHVKWNLTEALIAHERHRLADTQTRQAHLSYQDLRAKLALGVHEAREACLSAQEQIDLAQQQIKAAEEAFELSNTRLKENIKGRSPSEVLMAVRGLAGAKLSYLQAVRRFRQGAIEAFRVGGRTWGLGLRFSYSPTRPHMRAAEVR